MATKRGKQSGGKTSETRTKTQTKAATAKPAARRATPDRGTAPLAAPPRELTPLDRAEQLRAAIERSKLTAADPWAYTPKARRWGERAQTLVERLPRSGGAAALERELAALTAEVEADRDFQEAKRLF